MRKDARVGSREESSCAKVFSIVSLEEAVAVLGFVILEILSERYDAKPEKDDSQEEEEEDDDDGVAGETGTSASSLAATVSEEASSNC
jgi:hypothetical protein